MDNKKFASHAFIGINNQTGNVKIDCSCTNEELVAFIASLALYARQERNIGIDEIMLDYYYAFLTAETEDKNDANYQNG